jgi:hypothetical protein
VRARKELRVKNLSVLKYFLHGETTVSPTPFDTLELARPPCLFAYAKRRNAEDGCELQSESLM